MIEKIRKMETLKKKKKRRVGLMKASVKKPVRVETVRSETKGKPELVTLENNSSEVHTIVVSR